jgi:hypothetical protein
MIQASGSHLELLFSLSNKSFWFVSRTRVDLWGCVSRLLKKQTNQTAQCSTITNTKETEL